MTTSISPALRAKDKWREAAEAGFQLVPDLLLKHQTDLGLNALDVVVLINLTMHWWFADQRPFPRSGTIAKRMGVEPRTVQRSLAKMRELGLIERVTERPSIGEERQVCDLSGLQARLAELAKKDPIFLARSNRREQPKDAFEDAF